MKKSIQRNATRIAVIGALLAVAGAGVIAIVHAGGLATQPVGKISGELVITSEDGVKQVVVTATQTYLQSTKEGTCHVTIKKDGVRIAAASARLKADTQEQAAAAVSALVLYLTGKPARPGMQCQDVNEGGYRGLQCSDIKFEGDSRVFAEQADKVIDWWDAQARLTHTSYLSPVPSVANLGKLQLNAWKAIDNQWVSSYAILYFDPSDPTKIVGGTVRLQSDSCGSSSLDVVSGSLTSKPDAPGDFDLSFQASGRQFFANLAIDQLADGTIDVRGFTKFWPSFYCERYGLTVEGTGNTKFVVPGS